MDNIYLELAQSHRQLVKSSSTCATADVSEDQHSCSKRTEVCKLSLSLLKERVLNCSVRTLSNWRRRLLMVFSRGHPEINPISGLPDEEGLFRCRGGRLPHLMQRGIENYVEGNRCALRNEWNDALVLYQRALKCLTRFYGTNDTLMVAKVLEKIGSAYEKLEQLHLAYDSYGASLKIYERLLDEPGDERFVPVLQKLFKVRLEMKQVQ